MGACQEESTFWGLGELKTVLALLFFLFFFLFLLHRMECGILLSQAEIEPVLPAVKAQSLNHWTTREVQCQLF